METEDINEHALTLHLSRRLRRDGEQTAADHLVLLDERLRVERKETQRLQSIIDLDHATE